MTTKETKLKKYGYETIIGGTVEAKNIDRAEELITKALKKIKLINWTEIREIEPKSSSKKEYY